MTRDRAVIRRRQMMRLSLSTAAGEGPRPAPRARRVLIELMPVVLADSGFFAGDYLLRWWPYPWTPDASDE